LRFIIRSLIWDLSVFLIYAFMAIKFALTWWIVSYITTFLWLVILSLLIYDECTACTLRGINMTTQLKFQYTHIIKLNIDQAFNKVKFTIS
jgi:hypothetical protein